MDILAEKALRELSQMDDHEKHGELHIYIDENIDDLRSILRGILQLANEGAERNERDAA